jgi:23S rRNA U2552 (ribose-2'-O)-methylase RlmE/FtsJ
MDKKILTLYKLPDNEKINIMDFKVKPTFSAFPNMPLFKYGFYYYIHQTKDKMEKFDTPEFKSKELHKIINPFEDTVPQDAVSKQTKNDKLKIDDDINSFSIKYFKSNRIISRAFYKLWELLMMFPLIPDKAKNITTFHIAEAPGSFAQATMYYRNKFYSSDNISSDKYYATSIQPEKPKSNFKRAQRTEYYVPSFNSDLESSKQFNIWSYKDSDLTKIDVLNKFISDNKDKKVDFITADGGFNWKDENYQEQEAYILLLAEIICALKIQKEGGSFVIKFFETFTEMTIKLIEILKRFYETVLITKPLLSRPSNSERYIVCLNFSNKNADKIDDLITIVESFSKNNVDKYLVDIYPEYQIDMKLDLIIKLSSTEMSNIQHKQINEMITYIDEGNYYGERYRKYVSDRRNANDFWISTFYPISEKELATSRKSINTIIENILTNTKKTLEELSNKLILTNYQYEKYLDSDSESESESEKKVNQRIRNNLFFNINIV